MDLDLLKDMLGIELIDTYDTQLQAVIEFSADETTENLKFLSIACLLEGLAPEIIGQVKSWTIGGVSESYSLNDDETFCKRYQREKALLESESESFGMAFGDRAGQE